MAPPRGARPAIAAAAICCALVGMGCGSSGSKSTATASASSNAPVSLTVTSPASGSVVGSENVTVRGAVIPASVKVEINGHSAAVGGGAFAGVANLHPGQNTLNIIASAPGQPPGTTTLLLIRQASGSTSTTTTQHTEPAPTPQSKPSSTVNTTDGWPTAKAAWTVVLASVGSRGEAEAQRERARQAALPETGVLLSSQHSSLRAGYWVAFTGVLSHDEAVRRQQQARRSGFTDAYARFVSAE